MADAPHMTAWSGLAAVAVMSAAIFLAAEYLSIVDRPVRVANVCSPSGECADVFRYTADGGDATGRWLHRDDPNMILSGFREFGGGFWGRFPKISRLVIGGHDCSDGRCTVAVLYDESGNGNDLIQNDPTAQAHLIRGGSFWAVEGRVGQSMREADFR